MGEQEQCEECFQKMNRYFDDELTTLRIQIEELEDTIQSIRQILASILGGQVE